VSGVSREVGETGKDALRHVIKDSSLARTMHVTVLSIGNVAARPTRSGMTVCRANVVIRGGEGAYVHQYVRRDGQVFIVGQPARQ
jgi:hypothetical protein